MSGEKDTKLIEKLQHSRSEERWNIPPDRIQEVVNVLQSGYERILYSKPWVSTVYFGGVKEAEDGHEEIVPLKDVKVSLKAREFALESHNDQLKVLEPNSEYRFEAKLRPTWDDTSSRRRKYIVNGSLDAINQALFSGDYTDLFQNSNFPLELLPTVLKRMGCKRFVPIGMVQYLRQHYISNGDIEFNEGLRFTVDTNYSIWDIDWTGYCYVAAKIASEPHGVLEIKNQGGIAKYPSLINDLVSQLQPAQSKHDTLFAKVGRNLGTSIEVQHQILEQGWMINEKEQKVDINQDPRPWLKKLDLAPEFAITFSDEQLTKQIFYLLPDETQSACIMQYLSVKRPNQIKAKIQTVGSNSYKSRTEFAKPDSPENRLLVGEFLGIDISTIPFSPSFERKRVLRTIINQQTGRVFEITADCCVAEDNRPDLNQVEVEYIGLHSGFISNSPESDTASSIESDLSTIRSELVKNLQLSGFEISHTQTTKSKWIRS